MAVRACEVTRLGPSKPSTELKDSGSPAAPWSALGAGFRADLGPCGWGPFGLRPLDRVRGLVLQVFGTASSVRRMSAPDIGANSRPAPAPTATPAPKIAIETSGLLFHSPARRVCKMVAHAQTARAPAPQRMSLALRGWDIARLRLGRNGLPLVDRLIHGFVMRILCALLLVAGDPVLPLVRRIVGFLLMNQCPSLLLARGGATRDC
jgi:hypothetical protein